jgi:predicted DNA-binding protein YlxM (UPF0122 family)
MSYLLSAHFVNNMNTMREHQNEQFYLNVLSLHLSGWSLQEIANSFSVSKSAVANWEKKGKKLSAQSTTLVSAIEIPQKDKAIVEPSKEPKTPVVDFPIEAQQKILKLAQVASKVSRNTPLDAPSRIAAAELEDILYFYKTAGVPYSKLAAAAGVTRRAIAQRLDKRKKQNESGT